MKTITKNILATICYYDVFDFPLTQFEVWKLLINNQRLTLDYENERKETEENNEYSLANVIEELNNGGIRNYIEEKNGFYFLKRRKEIVEKRLQSDKISVAKIKKMRQTIWWLKFVPFVKMILVTGRLAMKNASAKSDWDVLVVLQKGRIWTGRMLVTIFLHLLGKRRYGRKIKNRVCLNYYLTDKSLQISEQDFFSANEYFFTFPIFDANNYFQKFQLKNRWIKKYHLNYYLTESSHLKKIEHSKISLITTELAEKIFDWNWLENFLRKIQLAKIKKNPNTKLKGSRIKATDDELVFLPQPQGPKNFKKFQEVFKSVNV